jgi:hypothetical protein
MGLTLTPALNLACPGLVGAEPSTMCAWTALYENSGSQLKHIPRAVMKIGFTLSKHLRCAQNH